MTSDNIDGEGPTQELSATLLDLLVCPIDHQTLAYISSENVLYNPRLKKSFEIREGIPVMLVEDSTDVDDVTHEKYINAVVRYTGPRDVHAM